MPFWTRRKPAKESTPASDTGKVQPAKKKPKTSPPSPLEVKLLAMEGLEAGLSASQVAEIVGVTETTISTWRKKILLNLRYLKKPRREPWFRGFTGTRLPLDHGHQ
jgi:hypothetical protein